MVVVAMGWGGFFRCRPYTGGGTRSDRSHDEAQSTTPEEMVGRVPPVVHRMT